MYTLLSSQSALVFAPAKLNLFLEVLGRRTDGFHQIETLMVPITLFDTLLMVGRSDGQLRLDCRWAHGAVAKGNALWGHTPGGTSAGRYSGDSLLGRLPEPQNNIVIQALDRFRTVAGVDLGADLKLIKRIPTSAGLGSASTDAAAALLAANHVWRLNWSRDQLAGLAGELGSDIPFFFCGSPAVCRGRGELVQTVGPIAKLFVVVVRPPIGLATQEVYRNCRPAESPCSVGLLLEALRRGRRERIRQALLNRLEQPALEMAPSIARLRNEFVRLGCWASQLSGSGSCYFGICRSASHARQVASQLRARNWPAVYCVSMLTPSLS